MAPQCLGVHERTTVSDCYSHYYRCHYLLLLPCLFLKKVSAGGYLKRVLYKGIFIEYNKTELVNIKTSLFLREKRRFLWPGLRKECSCDQIDFLKGVLHYFYAVTPFIECFMHWSLTNYATYLIITVLYSTVI